MEDEYYKYNEVIDELRSIMVKLSKTKLEKSKVFVEKLNSLTKKTAGSYIEGAVFSVDNERVSDSLSLKKELDKGNQYLMALVRFSNFLEDSPSIVKEMAAVNDYFKKISWLV